MKRCKKKTSGCYKCWHHGTKDLEWCDACAQYRGSEWEPNFFKALIVTIRYRRRLRKYWRKKNG